jgi:hypothetical protein
MLGRLGGSWSYSEEGSANTMFVCHITVYRSTSTRWYLSRKQESQCSSFKLHLSCSILAFPVNQVLFRTLHMIICAWAKSKWSKKRAWKRICLLPAHAGFFLGLFFDPEDGGNMLLRNVCSLWTTTWCYMPAYRTLLNSFGSGQGRVVVGSCEHSNQSSCPRRCF